MRDIRWSHLQNATHAAKQKLAFSNFPRYLWIQMQRYQLGPDWQPIKLQVELDIPQELDLTAWNSTGPQPGEDLVPPDDDNEMTAGSKNQAASPVIDEVALAQLMEMGFSLNICKRALAAVGGSNVEAAMGWVFEHNTDPDFNDPLPDNSASTDASGVDEGVVVVTVIGYARVRPYVPLRLRAFGVNGAGAEVSVFVSVQAVAMVG